ncbi:hypothetical protein Sjap_018967 [Stephania japonica]|uniref:Lariat debranching enzyme C-terminal domain-containing protein n=1 Tax=Stephania japonica TaxID=461633 RepID=A0AAP0HUA3_9MAGN
MLLLIPLCGFRDVFNTFQIIIWTNSIILGSILWPFLLLNALKRDELKMMKIKRWAKAKGLIIIQEKTLGSKAAAELIDKLKPQYWFSAHLHLKFGVVAQHGKGGSVTGFLPNDKCLPDRRFLQIVEIKSNPGRHEVQYAREPTKLG